MTKHTFDLCDEADKELRRIKAETGLSFVVILERLLLNKPVKLKK